MIIKSKVKTFGFWLAVTAVLLGSVALVFFSICIPLRINIAGAAELPLVGALLLFFVLILLIGIYGRLLWDSNIIEIDTDLQTIKLINCITRVAKVFAFDQFDSSIIVYERISGGFVRNYYLLKDGKVVKRITNFIYSNQDELEGGLQEIPSFGEMKYSWMNSAKILFGIPIKI